MAAVAGPADRREVVEQIVTVATITLESSNGDSVVVSAPTLISDDDIILDTDPKGCTTPGLRREPSRAFEVGTHHRAVDPDPGNDAAIPVNPVSRPRFQSLWAHCHCMRTPWSGPRHYDGPRARSLTPKLARQIDYTTEDGFDADVYGEYRVSALAVNLMYESAEDVSESVNSGNFTVWLAAVSGTFKLGYAGQLTSPIAYNATAATVQAALAGLSTIGAGNVTVGPAR